MACSAFFFTRMLQALTRDDVTHIAVVFDVDRGSRYRYALHPNYKAGRNERPPELDVQLPLIKQIVLGPDSTEIKMILTTPFCPYAGSMIQQVKEQAESVVEHDVKVTLLAERWDPRDAGLMW